MSAAGRFRHVARADCVLDYRHLKKLSISPPFNFQHVSHTARTQLPPLESTSQKDLVAEFWAVSAYQSPRQQLHGIDAEDLTAKHESMGITRGSPSSRPTSPTSPTLNLHQPRVASPLGDVLCADDADDTEPREAYFNDRSGTAHRSLRSADPVFHPRRSSSVGAMGFQYSSPAVSKQAARPAIAQDDTNNQTRAVGPSESSAALDAVPEESVDRVSSSPRTSGKRVRKSSTSSKQDLAKRPSQSSLKSSRECGTSRRTFMVPAGKADSIAATRSSCYTHRSAASSSNADLPGPGTGTDPTWEDDVDFCYELEAEASCDFDWDNGQHEREPSVESDGGVLLYPHTFTPPSTSKSPSKTPKQKASVGSLSAASPSGASSAKTRMSVGHRGFLEARHSRQASRESLTGPAIAPSTLKVTLTPGSLGGLSPIFSVIGAEDEIPKLSPALGAMHFSGFDSNGVESLSDPESTRSGGSKHRKSSSYGSYESISRPAPASRDTARWSVASISNVPDLLHSHRNDKLPLQGKRISTPLEVKSRKSGVQVPHIRSVSSTSALRPDRTPQEGAEKLIMRRPKTPEDRALLQAAGRAVQRGRPGTPNRFSRLLSPPPELPGDSARLSATNSSPDVSPCRLSQFPVPPSVPEGWI